MTSELLSLKDFKITYNSDILTTTFSEYLNNANYDGIEKLLDSYKYVIDYKDPLTGGTLLHLASNILKWDSKAVSMLLDHGSRVNIPDKKGQTPLHWAVSGGCYCVSCNRRAAKVVELLLQNTKTSEIVDIQDGNGDTCLHLAARNSFSEPASMMIDKGADITLQNFLQMGTKYNLVTTLIQNIPLVLEDLLDKAVESYTPPNGSSNFHPNSHQTQTLRIDLGILLLRPKLPVGASRKALTAEERLYRPETEFLHQLLNARQEVKATLLTHPVVTAFLFTKWKSASKYLALTRVLHFVISAVYTHFVLVYYLQNCPYIYDSNFGNTNMTMNVFNWKITLEKQNATGDALGENDEHLRKEFRAFDLPDKCTPWNNCYGLAWTILLYTLFFPTKLMIERLLVRKIKIFTEYIQLLWLVYIICMIGTSIPPIFKFYPPNWMHSWAALTTWFTWTMILAQYALIPSIAIYIEMLGQVLKTIVFCVFVYGFLVVGFAFGFHVFFPENGVFESPVLSFVKVVTLMLGETDYEGIFGESSQDEWINIPAHIFYSGFLILCTIVLMNLLIGLSVSDIKKLKDRARTSKIETQIKTLKEMELHVYNKHQLKYKFWPLRWTYAVSDYFTVVKPTKSPRDNSWYLYFQPHNPKCKLLPKSTQYKLFNLYKTIFCRDTSLYMHAKNCKETFEA